MTAEETRSRGSLPSVPAGLPGDTIHLAANLLNSVSIRLLRKIRHTDRVVSGLTAPRASTLSVLVFAGPQTIGRLAHLEQVSPAAMTKMVDGLEADGLVERRRSTSDRRVVIVEATVAGTSALEEMRSARVASLARHLERFSDDELAVILEAMELLAGSL
jgi:DNA-binding MarR family transcriptional regulator